MNVAKKLFAESDVVLLVDDHEIVRYGMRLMIEALGCTVLEAATGEEGIDLARKHRIDLVFMDIALPGIDGITASSQLLQLDDKLIVIMLTALPPTSIPREILRTGEIGYMAKSSAADEIGHAIGQALAGELYLCPVVAEQLALENVAEQLALEKVELESVEQSPFENLSQRECQVVLLLIKGYRNREVGDTLRLNAKTVSTYKRRAYEKLGVSSTAELIKLATCWEYIEP